MSYELRNFLNEEPGSNLLDSFTTYNLFDEASKVVNNRIKHVKKNQSITTVADQTDYTLNADFSQLYRVDNKGSNIIIYSDGTNRYFLKEKDEDIFVRNQITETVTSVTVPDNFAIVDDSTLDSQVTGTCTSAGALSAGKATLTDSAAAFSDVSAGDNIHNTTDGSIGIVISKTSSTVLVTALFGGTDNDWDSSDAYVIQPSGRYKLVLDPPPSSAGNTITVPYVAIPAPVYSDYDMFRLPNQYKRAILFYAAWLYKYRNDEPNFGDKWFVAFDMMLKNATKYSNKALHRDRVIVNFNKKHRNY